MDKKKYFGIQFPEECALSEERKAKFAKKLFLSPTTDIEEIKKIINHSELIQSYDSLTNAFDMDLLQIGDITCDNDVDDTKIERKVLKWKDEFSLPYQKELLELLETEELNDATKNAIESLLILSFKEHQSEPDNISKYLKTHVFGQDEAIEDLSILIHEHKIKIKNPDKKLPDNFVMIIGQPSSGKTYMMNKLKSLTNYPVERINCACLVPSGIKGNTLNEYLTRLYLDSNKDLNIASKGVLVFDDIDKIALHRNSELKHEYALNLQQELLPFLDKTEKIRFKSDFSEYSELISMPVKNLTIIFSGTFIGLEYIIKERIGGNVLSFLNNENIFKHCSQNDIKDYGFIPEFVSRITLISILNPLDIDDYVRIIKNNPDSDLSKHINKCKTLGINLKVTDEAIEFIANHMKNENLSIRSLSQLLSSLLKNLYMNILNYKGKTYLVGRDDILKHLLSRKFSEMIMDIKSKMSLNEIAEKYNISKDTVLEIYSMWNQSFGASDN